jgi:Ni,Fe-hydrogenase III large subunit
MTMHVLVDGTCRLDEVPLHGPEVFYKEVVAACKSGSRIVALPAIDDRGSHQLLAVLAHDGSRSVQVLRMTVPANLRYPSLTPELPQAQAFERELAEDFGLVPEGHPWPKPLRRHADLETPGHPDEHKFFRMEGAGVHEVAVGPVHAGIIEPGHFRFQCYGETVHSLEIQLGYQKRGAEKLLLSSSPTRRMAIVESIAGDTAIGHGLAHVTALEKLSGAKPPQTAQILRAIALELERMDSHTGDLGALCNDVGYQPGASWYGRLRGDFLNLLIELSGNRFGRGLLVHGGVRFQLPASERAGFMKRFETATTDFERIADVIFDAPSVVSRFEHTGSLSKEIADELGLVGTVARACGLDRDARRDHPEGLYRFTSIPVAVRETGDVMARAEVRREEVGHAVVFVRTLLEALVEGPVAGPPTERLQPSSLSVSMIEGWRGEIVHVAISSADGQLAGYKIVDPSFHNWFGLAIALRGNQISDFPLCNKSFNLSYAGHDL